MHSMKLFVIAAVVLSSFVGCGPAGQPRIFRVAIDTTPVKTLNKPECFKGNMPNLNQITQEQNFRKEATWVVWEAAEKKQYLDMGSATRFTLADAPTINVDNLIEGADNVFSATRQQQDRGAIIELSTTNIVTTFADLGATPTGTVQLNAQYQCQSATSPCPAEPSKRGCSAQLSFWARRIEVSQNTNYAPEGTSITETTK